MDKKYLVVKKRSEVSKVALPEFEIRKTGYTVKIENSIDMYAAEKITAPFDIPQFKKSLVDGYAIRAKDVMGASPSNPVPLKIKAKLKIGENYKRVIKQNETVFVPTGGIVPKGADAVVMIEYTETQGKELFIYKDVYENENLLDIGDDIKKGKPVLEKGERITSRKIATLRAFGIKELTVYEKVKIGIVSTGNELLDAGKPNPGKIFDINGYMLFAEASNAGFAPEYYGILTDNKKLIKKTLEKMLEEKDVVIMSGGTSKGNYDYTISAIEGLKNGKVLLHGLHLSPGKPTVLGIANKKLVAGLSGNPLASFFVFKKVIAPLICDKCGFKCTEKKIFAEVTENIPSKKGREEFVIGKLILKNGKNFVKPLYSESAFVGVLSEGDGFITIPLLNEGIKKGEKVEFELW